MQDSESYRLTENDFRTLAIGDLSFGDVPFGTLKHFNEKNRQDSMVPFRSELAAELREWTRELSTQEYLFHVTYSLLEILGRDIEAVGIPKIDAEGCLLNVYALSICSARTCPWLAWNHEQHFVDDDDLHVLAIA